MNINNSVNLNDDAGQESKNSMMAEVPQEGLLQVVWRRHWVVLIAVVVCLAGGFGYLQKATPIFSSTARLYVEQSGPRIMTEQDGVMAQPKNYLYTQCALIGSTPILASVLENPEIARLNVFDNVDNPIGYLKNVVQASVGKKDDIISVAFESADPTEAAQVVNAVVDAYITYHATQKRSTASEVLRILQNEKAERDEELSGRYQAILDFRQANGALTLEDDQGNIMIRGLSRLHEALTDARIETISARANYEAVQLMSDDPTRLKQLIETQRSSGVYISFDQEESNLRSELNSLQQRLSDLDEKLTDDHSAILTLNRSIAQIQQQLGEMDRDAADAYLEVARQCWVAAEQREMELQAAADVQREEVQQLSTKAAELAILESELRRTESLCDILDSRIKELNVTEDVGALNISILEVARPADSPSKPQKSRIMAMALVLGIMLGVGLALVLDWTDKRLRSADEIAAILDVPVLGTVPHMKRVDPGDRGRLVHDDPMSHIAEAYKTIRTAVYFGVPEGKAKTILVTSPAPGDGKSTMVSNLATAMAQAGQRTLIIDCDFRKPTQHYILGQEQEPGISSVLAGQEKLENVIRDSANENLKVITCGPIPVNPSELLNSPAFADILSRLCQEYDRVLIDSPPVMAVADTRILAALSDVTLVVLSADKSTRKGAMQARSGLMSVSANVLGAVVNNVPHRKGRYGYYNYGSGYGGYGYGYGYGHEKGHKAVGDETVT